MTIDVWTEFGRTSVINTPPSLHGFVYPKISLPDCLINTLTFMISQIISDFFVVNDNTSISMSNFKTILNRDFLRIAMWHIIRNNRVLVLP